MRSAFTDADRRRNVSAVHTTSAIFIGGFLKWILNRITERRSAEQKLLIEEKGTLLALALIAGEAIVGILLAVLFITGIQSIATFRFVPAWGGWLSLIGFAAIAYVLIRIPARAG